MSMFKDENERNKFLLEQASIILSGLLSAERGVYYDHVKKLFDGDLLCGDKASITSLHEVIFRDLKEALKDA